MGKMLSIFLTVALAVASMGTLAYMESVRGSSAIAFGSPSAVSTVRAYYAAVNHYMATGEIEAVVEITGDGAIGDADHAGSECAVPSLLPALRRTYPHIHISIDDLLRDGSTVVARVSVEAGQAAAFGPVAIPLLEHWRMTEIFTVEDGHIAGCASFGPGQALVAATHRMPSAIPAPGALVVARISFSVDSLDYLSIPAPAILSVEHGTLTALGNRDSVLTRVNGQREEPTESGRTYQLTPGDVLAVPAGRVVFHNAKDQPARLLATTIVPEVGDIGEAEGRSPAQRLIARLASPAGGDIGGGVSVRPLARSTEIIEAGAIELMTATITLTLGGSATVEGAATDMVLIPLIGNPVVERSVSNMTIQNLDGDRVLVQIAGVDESTLS